MVAISGKREGDMGMWKVGLEDVVFVARLRGVRGCINCAETKAISPLLNFDNIMHELPEKMTIVRWRPTRIPHEDTS